MRILALDDEHAVRDARRRALNLAGYEVEVAPTAEPAIGLMRKRWPDPIVLDVLMAGMSGLTGRHLNQRGRIEIRHLHGRLVDRAPFHLGGPVCVVEPG
jgi:DNA-binding response OmpR family regulator